VQADVNHLELEVLLEGSADDLPRSRLGSSLTSPWSNAELKRGDSHAAPPSTGSERRQELGLEPNRGK